MLEASLPYVRQHRAAVSCFGLCQRQFHGYPSRLRCRSVLQLACVVCRISSSKSQQLAISEQQWQLHGRSVLIQRDYDRGHLFFSRRSCSKSIKKAKGFTLTLSGLCRNRPYQTSAPLVTRCSFLEKRVFWIQAQEQPLRSRILAG